MPVAALAPVRFPSSGKPACGAAHLQPDTPMINRFNLSASSASRHVGAAAFAFGLLPAIGLAASVSFQTPTTFTTTSVLDAPLSVSGYTNITLVQAQNFGGNAQTVTTPASQTINFANAPENSGGPASGTVSAVFYGGSETNANLFAGNTGSAAFDAVLDSQSWATQQAGGNRQTVRIGGLTIGQTYIVQLLFSDQRTGNGGRTQFLADATSGGNTSATFSTASATSLLASFSATAVTQDIFLFPGVGTSAPNDTTVAAFTLYSATAVPEPASFASVAGLLALGAVGLRRSRRR